MTPRERISTQRRFALHRAVLRWYRTHGRKLPWRATSNPYRILVSEIMLQQTQVARVREKYPEFLSHFPSLGALAQAGASEVIRAWRGMGYNNRSVRLHHLARLVSSDNGGRLPSDPELLRRLPGIGPYTAHAVACFAFGRRLPVVDTNIRRLLNRWIGRQLSEREIWSVARSLLPRRAAPGWNQALMDLGALVCTARSPDCRQCPVSRLCRSAHRVRNRAPVRSVREPMYRGVPDRIYRGRIIDLLRGATRGGFVDLKSIGESVLPSYHHQDSRWLTAILQALERDGIIRLRMRNRVLRAGLVN